MLGYLVELEDLVCCEYITIDDFLFEVLFTVVFEVGGEDAVDEILVLDVFVAY